MVRAPVQGTSVHSRLHPQQPMHARGWQCSRWGDGGTVVKSSSRGHDTGTPVVMPSRWSPPWSAGRAQKRGGSSCPGYGWSQVTSCAWSGGCCAPSHRPGPVRLLCLRMTCSPLWSPVRAVPSWYSKAHPPHFPRGLAPRTGFTSPVGVSPLMSLLVVVAIVPQLPHSQYVQPSASVRSGRTRSPGSTGLLHPVHLLRTRDVSHGPTETAPSQFGGNGAVSVTGTRGNRCCTRRRPPSTD